MNYRDPDWGYFTGPVNVKWVTDDPRLMIVIDTDVVYVDRSGFRWIAVIGQLINGASVPWLFRRIFPAYVGKYRRATVVHDVACNYQDKSSEDVHRMFYEAMRCDGVGAVQGWIMWAAVRVFGPRFAAKEPRDTDSMEEVCLKAHRDGRSRPLQEFIDERKADLAGHGPMTGTRGVVASDAEAEVQRKATELGWERTSSRGEFAPAEEIRQLDAIKELSRRRDEAAKD